MRAQNYYPECRKDAQCKCKKCVESLNATRDLRQPSASANGSTSKKMLRALGLGFGSPLPGFISGSSCRSRWFELGSSPTPPRTPLFRSEPRSLVLEPAFDEIAAQNSVKTGRKVVRLMTHKCTWLVLFMLLLVDFLAPVTISKFINPELSPEVVFRMVEESRTRVKTADRLDLIQRRIQLRVGRDARVSNCTGSASKWNLAEEGAFIHSYCRLYSSTAEQVSLWGYPMATAGVLGRKPISRDMTVLSGRVFEWQEGQPEYIIHNEGEYWTHHRWSASAIHLDKNTWIVEYSGSSLGKSWGAFSATAYTLGIFFRSVLLNFKWLLDSFSFLSLRLPVNAPLPT